MKPFSAFDPTPTKEANAVSYDEWADVDYDPDRDEEPASLCEDERALTWEQQIDRADQNANLLESMIAQAAEERWKLREKMQLQCTKLLTAIGSDAYMQFIDALPEKSTWQEITTLCAEELARREAGAQ